MRKKLKMTAGVLALTTVLAACGQSAEVNTAGTESSQTESSVSTDSADASSGSAYEVATVRWADWGEDYHTGFPDTAASEAGISVAWDTILNSDWADKKAVLLAGGDLPDAFMGSICFSESDILTNTGSFIALDDYIDEYMPNFKAIIESDPTMKALATSADGHIYGLPSKKPCRPTVANQMFINKQWLDNLGLEVPTTYEEFENVLTAFKEQDADGDGDPTNEIPYDFCEAFFASKIEFLAWMFGQPVTESVFYNITDEGEVVGAVDTDAYRAFLEYAHQLVEEELVSIDGFTQTYDQWAANLNSMKVGFFLGWGPCNYITKSEDFLNITGILTPAAEGYTARMYKAKEIRASRNGFIISKYCQNVDAALMVWNYWSDPEMAITVTSGERGLFWEYVDDDYNFRGNTNVPEITDERLIDLAIAEPDAISFVAGSLSADGSSQAYGESLATGEIPLFYTYDPRWGYVAYADGIIGVTGSGPTALSMAAMGLTGKNTYDPASVAASITSSNLASGTTGMDDSYLTGHAGDVGLAATGVEASSDGIYNPISEGQLVIIKLKSDSGVGSAMAHWALIIGINPDNSVTVYDPTSSYASTHSWSLGAISSRTDTAYALTAGTSTGTSGDTASGEYDGSETEG